MRVSASAAKSSCSDRSAWLTQPYQLPPPGKRTRFAGYPMASDEVAAELATRAYANGWQVAVQANGDAAIEQFIGAGIEAIERLRRLPEMKGSAELALQRDAHVLKRGEMREHRRDLERAHDAAPCDLRRPLGGDVGAGSAKAREPPLAVEHRHAAKQHGVEFGAEAIERTADAMAHSACLAGKAAANHGALDIECASAVQRNEWLVDDHAQHRAREVASDFFAVHSHIAFTWLDPDAGNRVLALAGGIGAALGVDLLDVDRSGLGLGRLDATEIGERLENFSHDQTLAFLLLSAATSSVSGDWAAWGCSAPL